MMLQEAPFRKRRSWRECGSGKNSPDGWQKFKWCYKRRLLEREEVDENGGSSKNAPDGWRKFEWCYRRGPLESEEVHENGRSGKNSPWVWQIGWHSGLLESGDYDQNGEYDKNSETSQQWRIWPIAKGLVKILMRLKEALLAKKKS